MIDQIKKRLENGFHPFAVRLTDGRRYEIPHRDFIAVHPKRVAVIDPDGLVISINPLHIVSVDDLAPAR
jgi:hypothetical protein